MIKFSITYLSLQNYVTQNRITEETAPILVIVSVRYKGHSLVVNVYFEYCTKDAIFQASSDKRMRFH